MRSRLIWIVLMLAGALILCPAVAYVDLPPLPGDFTFLWGNTQIYMPFVTSLIVSVSLTLLFLLLRR